MRPSTATDRTMVTHSHSVVSPNRSRLDTNISWLQEQDSVKSRRDVDVRGLTVRENEAWEPP